jgi:hypothetical protein
MSWVRDACGGGFFLTVSRKEKRKHELEKSVDVVNVFKKDESKEKNIPKPIDGHQLRQTNSILETAIGAIGACLAITGTLLVIVFFAAQTRGCFGVAHACAR